MQQVYYFLKAISQQKGKREWEMIKLLIHFALFSLALSRFTQNYFLSFLNLQSRLPCASRTFRMSLVFFIFSPPTNFLNWMLIEKNYCNCPPFTYISHINVNYYHVYACVSWRMRVQNNKSSLTNIVAYLSPLTTAQHEALTSFLSSFFLYIFVN